MSDKTPTSTAALASAAASETFNSASTPAVPPATRPVPWREIWKVYAERATLRMLVLGFSAGLPLLLVFGTLSFWLREAGVDRTTIGYLSWVGLAYGFKWMWAPLVDRLPIPLLTRLLGRRRSWLLVSQLTIMAGLTGMALTDPRLSLLPMVWCALAVAFASATQDIALDAFRIESADVQRQAALAAAYQTGYRIAMIWAGAGVLWIAARAEVPSAAAYQPAAWRTAYLVMAASMLLGIVTVLLSGEPAARSRDADHAETAATRARFAREGVPLYGLVMLATLVAMLLGLLLAPVLVLLLFATVYNFFLLPLAAYVVLLVALARSGQRVQIPAATVPAATWFTHAFFIPFADFVRRYGKQALLILALIAVYRISDVVMGIMANPFYVDMGYTKDEVATVTKVYGVIMTLVGAFAGGALALRFGVMRVLMLGAVLSAGSNLLFAWLGTRGHDVSALVFVISADNLSSGIASAAFIAYLSSLTNVNYSATQYALFSSMMLLLPKFLAGYSGKFVDAYGYTEFFTATAWLGLPVLLLVWLASRIRTPAAN
ncbi:MAG: permease [Polaromonas sp.]|nr:permease [Polaromonas sp.]